MIEFPKNSGEWLFWLFGGLGIPVVGIVFRFIFRKMNPPIFDKRFGETIILLNCEEPIVVLGGIGELHTLAIENKKYRKKVHKIFCSYIRKNSAKIYNKIDFKETPNKCPEIIQELIDCLFKPYSNEKCIYENYKANLSYCNFKNCNFENREIKNAIFKNCVFENCNFTNSTITSCKFDNGKLNSCQFNERGELSVEIETMHEVEGGYSKEGILTHCTFCDATLINCSFSEKKLFFCDFSNGNLKDCTFFNGDLSNCKFNVNLHDCNFRGTKIQVCSFENGELYNCNFYNGTLSSCCFEKTRLIDSCKFEKGRFYNCWFTYSKLKKCRFDSGTLTECRFGGNIGEGTVLEKCNFDTTNLFFCKTEYAKLIETKMPDNSFEYPKSLKKYKKTLKIGRKLPKEKLKTYLVRVAQILYNTIQLNKYINKYPSNVKKHKETLRSYCELTSISLSTVTLQYMLDNFKKSRFENILVLDKHGGILGRCGKILEEKLKKSLALVASILANLASLHRDAKEYPNALKEIEEALEIFRYLAEENPIEYLTYATMTLNDLANISFKVGENCYNQKNYNEAEKHYLRCLEITRELTKDNPTEYFPAIAIFQYSLGLIYTKINEYPKVFEAYEEALKIFRIHADDDPNYSQYMTAILYNLGLLYSKNKEYSKVLEVLEEATKINPNKDLYFFKWGEALANLAKLNNDASLYRTSIEKYKEAAKINPNKDLYFLMWGNALADLAKFNNDEILYRESLKKYEEAIRINPEYYVAFNNWGFTLYELAKFKNDVNLYIESFEKYEKATSINPKYDLAFTNWSTSLLYLYAFNNDVDLLPKALNVCQRAYEINKQKSYNLACCYARLKDKKNALKYLEESLMIKDIKDQTVEWILNDNDWQHYLNDEDFMNLLNKYQA